MFDCLKKCFSCFFNTDQNIEKNNDEYQFINQHLPEGNRFIENNDL